MANRHSGRPPLLAAALVVATAAIGAWHMWTTCGTGFCFAENMASAIFNPTPAVKVSVQPRTEKTVSTGGAEAQSRVREQPKQINVVVSSLGKDPDTRPTASQAAPSRRAAKPAAEEPVRDAPPIRAWSDTTDEEVWTSLTETALSDPDPARRSEAIHTVSVQRDQDSMAVLTEVAASDMEASNRYEAVQSIWRAMANGLDDEGAARDALTLALDDVDPDVAELARRALDDLTELERRRAEQ